MGRALYEVITDLVRFVFGSSNTQALVVPTLDALEETIDTHPLEEDTIDKTLHGVTAYVYNTTPLFTRPMVSFDNQMGEIFYGESVVVLRSEGLYSEILYKDQLWWVRSDTLSTQREMVFPQFLHNESLLHDNANTIKVRQHIRDECNGGQLYLPLQSFEYILFQLKQKKIVVNWPSIRPRSAGRLQVLLKGAKNVHIGVEPKTGAVLEYYNSVSTAVIAYVEEVHPDLSIKISSVGRTAEGLFEVETIEALTWREWRPVFISFK
jgi:hypothetical protein